MAKLKTSRKTCGLKPKLTVSGRGGGDEDRGTELQAATRRKSKRAAGERLSETESSASSGAPPTGTAGEHQHECVRPAAGRAVANLLDLQRQRVAEQKMRIATENRIVAYVAGSLGYRSGLDESERGKKFDEARKLIKAIRHGTPLNGHSAIGEHVAPIVMSYEPAMQHHRVKEKGLEKEMAANVAEFPAITAWLDAPEQRGLTAISVAKIVGECGDLANYANPGKLWKRMGCAPFNEKMPATWRRGKEGKLSAAEWEQIGYSPRRRAIMFQISDPVMKGNKTGPYRKRYEQAKALFSQRHPDYAPIRCEMHAQLMIAKLVLKNLWIVWRGQFGDLADEAELPGSD